MTITSPWIISLMTCGLFTRNRMDTLLPPVRRTPLRSIRTRFPCQGNAISMSRLAVTATRRYGENEVVSAVGQFIEHREGISDPLIALTFDDGPSEWTDPILERLRKHGSTATFFV